MKRSYRQLMVLCLLLFWIDAFSQQTQITQFHVGATIEAGCKINVMNHEISLGNIANNLTNQPVDKVFFIQMNCTPKLSTEIGLNDGLHATANGQRYLASINGGHKIAYNLYQDQNHTQPWNNMSNRLYFKSGVDRNPPIPVYVKLITDKEQHMLPAGLYSDTLMISVYF